MKAKPLSRHDRHVIATMQDEQIRAAVAIVIARPARNPRLITAKEIAERICVTPKYLSILAKRGGLPVPLARRTGTTAYYDRAAAEAWIAAGAPDRLGRCRIEPAKEAA